MTREKIENFREVILPFNRRVLLKIDYEGQGASDAEEFAKDFNEILNLAIKALEQEPQSFKWCETCKEYDQEKHCCHRYSKVIRDAVAEIEQESRWIPVSERLPETDGENSINNYDVLLWVKDKNDPDDEPQIYLGKLRQVKGDDGSGNFWGIKTEPCDWTIWGWSYFHEPEVIAWHPLPEPYKAEIEPQESEGSNADSD